MEIYIFLIVTYPFEITKTRLQLQNEMMTRSTKGDIIVPKKLGMFRTAINIAKNEGKMIFIILYAVNQILYK